MKTHNQQLFEDLDSAQYAKDFKTLLNFGFRKLEAFQEVLGYDALTDSWVVVHQQHSASGLQDELPTCRVLKKNGFTVALLEESVILPSIDASVDGILYEMKRVSTAANIKRAIERHFRLAYKKSDKVILHIDLPVPSPELVIGLRVAAYNVKKIAQVLLVYEDKIYHLTHDDMIAGIWYK